ncbi:hypothetical protein LI90_2526 [Carbonactinospora thermoautotrophica]|uniref:Uncharacterized protein n=1 Tax=Carbonactinospora thermoautotrophica TaxID=1469144 RepID=A0A132MUL9_9ACTN|nr:hypothetical protein LI90_2526 [Carbonactinospora thermoautotrophica]
MLAYQLAWSSEAERRLGLLRTALVDLGRQARWSKSPG